MAKSLQSLTAPEGWRLGEVSASFGITLTAEAGVIVSKASAAATFEVSVKFTRGPVGSGGRWHGPGAGRRARTAVQGSPLVPGWLSPPTTWSAAATSPWFMSRPGASPPAWSRSRATRIAMPPSCGW